MSCLSRQYKAVRALDRLGSARFSPARIRRMSAHHFGTYRHQKPVTAEKHVNPFAWKQVLAFRTLRTFRNCSDTCRKVCAEPSRADAVRGLPFVSIEFYVYGLCRSEPCRSDPIQCALSFTLQKAMKVSVLDG
jgi:hypothetical protein